MGSARTHSDQLLSAQNTDPQKNDKDILKEVLDEMNKKEKDANLKNLKQFWKPAHKPFFDQECRDAYEKIYEQALKIGYDLDSKIGDFKKFKNKIKEECTKYFQLLETKRTGFNAKKKTKFEEKVKSAVKKDDESQALEVDSNSNKKTKFSGDVSEESPKKKVKVETEADVDETIEKVDKELKKERRKQAKLAKKLQVKAKKEEEGGEEDGAKLKTSDETPIKKKAPFWKKKIVDGGVKETSEDTSAKNHEPVNESSTNNSNAAVLDISTVKKSKNKKIDGVVKEAFEDTAAKKTEAADASASETFDTKVLDVSTVKKPKKKKADGVVKETPEDTGAKKSKKKTFKD